MGVADGPPPVVRAEAPTRAQHLRSGVFALVFAPIALVVLGLSVTDTQAMAAVGQPLSSSVATVGVLISTVLLGLIAANSDESPVGMIVTTAWSFIIGALQLLGLSHVPSSLLSPVSGPDTAAAMRWCLYPLAVFMICLMSTLAVVAVRRRAVLIRGEAQAGSPNLLADRLSELTDAYARGPVHHRERVVVLASSVVLTCAAVICLVWAAPSDTTAAAAAGLHGMVQGLDHRLLASAAAALCLGGVAWGSRWSVFGAQVCAVALMVVPFALVLPVWSSLSGNVATPGVSALTSVSMAAPVITALGLVVGAMSLGAHWTRRHLRAGIAREMSQHSAPGGGSASASAEIRP